MLVTDGDRAVALAAVRSLGRAGYRVHVCATRSPSLAGASRFARGVTRTADPLHDPEAFRRDIRAALAASGATLVLPVTDPSHLALLGARDALRGVTIIGPSFETFTAICNKAAVAAVAREVGIRIPEQTVLERAADLGRMEPSLRFPLILKPARSVAAGKSWLVAYAGSPDELRARVASFPTEAFPLLLQQRIVGPGVGVFLLLWDGVVRAAFQHQRVREFPPSGGGSTNCISVPLDPRLARLSANLLRRHDWQGVAMVEFKVDRATGEAYLMEVNGRLWGSLQLAIDAGVDFPRLLVEAALGRPAAPPPPYQSGVRVRMWWRDVDHLLARLRHSDQRLNLAPDAPSRRRVLADFFTWHRRERADTLRWDDPAPFIADTWWWLRARLGAP